MEELTPEGANDPDEMKIVIESLYDTFIKYLDPEAIFNNDKWINEHKTNILPIQSSRENAVQHLISWILDDNVYKEAVCHFLSALTKLTYENGTLHPAIGGGTDDEKIEMSQNMKHIVHILDGSLIKSLSLPNMGHILDKMVENRLISEKVWQKTKAIDNPQKSCLKMLRKINKGKPDWPLVFLKNIDSVRFQEIDSSQQYGISEMLSDIQPNCNSINKNNEYMSDYSEFSSLSSNSKVYMSKEQQAAPEIMILIESGNLAESLITSDPSCKKPENKHHASALSDEEDDNELNLDAADHEEAASLNLRNYQIELAENALKGRNTIICAPTGSGKTRVATHIILSHLQQKENNEKRKIAFLARTVPLVMQQCKSLKKYLPKNFEVTSLTGDSEDSMHLHLILKDIDVIVMTPRILENHLKKKCLPHLGEFSMLVFDECHHTRKGEPYNTLMYSYLKTKKQISDEKERGDKSDIKLPQIVGLTASISIEKAVQDDEAVKEILQVCANLDAESISCVVKNEEELTRLVPVPEEKLLKLNEKEDDKAVEKIIEIMDTLEKAIENHAKEIKHDELNNLLRKIPSDKKSQQYGQWAVKIRNIAKAFPRKEHRETIGPVRALIIIANFLSAYNVALELRELVLLEHVLTYLDKCFNEFIQNESRSNIEQFCLSKYLELKKLLDSQRFTENENLTRLKKVLSEYLIAKGEKSCGIIFVRTRALTEALAYWLNSCDDENLKKLKATVFTGTAASVDQGGMTTAEQDEVIQRFKSGDIRLLVSTSVGEEGIDIPECNLVIKYNHVGNEVTTVQTRGRSRKAGGMSILLAMEKIIRKERINQEKAKMMERAIKTIRNMKRAKIRKLNKTHQQKIMKEEEILQIVKEQEEDQLQKKNFKMVCHWCRKVVIDSKDIKTIFQTHHVVVNRDILNQTKTFPYKGTKYVDELRMIGSVRCYGEPETGKHCNNKLGSMMVYSKIPFVVLGIKNFGFDIEGPLGLEYYNQWKKVPYVIDEINPSDFKRYLPQKPVIKEIEDKSDDDEDSGDEDDDDDKGNKPNSKSMELYGSPSTLEADVAHSDNPNNSTVQKRVADASDKVSGTEPKRMHTSDSIDSGFPNNSAGASSSAQSLTNLKQPYGKKNSAAKTALKIVNSELLLGVSTYRSNETHHQTPCMPESTVNQSERRIKDHQFMLNCDRELGNAPTLETAMSTFTPVSAEPESELQCSFPDEEDDYNEDSNSAPSGNNNESTEEVSRTSSDHRSIVEATGSDHRSTSEKRGMDSNQKSTSEANEIDSNHRNATTTIQGSSDHNEDSTIPKEALQELDDNSAGQQGQSHQSIDDSNRTRSQSFTFFDL